MARPGTRTASAAGMALVVGLLLLAALSLLALAAAASMALQHRMAGNLGDGLAARQAASLAAMRGESLVFGLGASARLPGCQSNCFQAPGNVLIAATGSLPPHPEHEGADWWQQNAALVEIPGWTSEPPRFLAEELHFTALPSPSPLSEAPDIDGIGYYRILGRGSGRGDAAVAVYESIIARPWQTQPAGAGDVSAGPSAGAAEDMIRDSGGSAEAMQDSAEFCAPFRPWYDCGRMAWRLRR